MCYSVSLSVLGNGIVTVPIKNGVYTVKDYSYKSD